MTLPELWLSPPVVRFPSTVRTNEDVLALVRAGFKGSEADWAKLENRLRSLWRACGTDRRAWELDPLPFAAKAVAPAEALLAAAGIAASDLDIVAFASIAREYFEPATAAEVAGRLGADRALAYDTIMACAGSLLAIQQVVGQAAIDPTFQRALVSTATMTYPGYVTFDLQSADDVELLGAGLTLGNASTAWLVTRERLAMGGGRIRGVMAEGLSQHHALCKAPVDGHFISDGPRIFALATHIPDHWRRLAARVGWSLDEIDLFLCHQPSNSILRGLAKWCGVPHSRFPQLHGFYGNCAESSVPVAMRHVLDEGRLKPGMKVLLSAAASGFAMGTVLLEWE